MKITILILSLLVASTAGSFAQCGKKVIINSSKTDHLDQAGTVTQTQEETAVVEISKTNISINVNDQHKMSGAIKSNVCDWPVPFKTGKTVLKASLSDDSGQEKNVTITIEGKNGKVTLLFEIDNDPNERIRITPDKFQEEA